MKTDTIFYQLFQTFPNIFFELIGEDSGDRYSFSSVEIKQLAFRIDGVFLPNTPQSSIYFVEVQFQPDRKFYSRFFAEIFLYLSQTELNNNWRGVIIYPSQAIDNGETERYIELLNQERVRRIYINELEDSSQQSVGVETIKLIIEPEESTEAKAKTLIAKVRQEIPDEQKQNLLQLIETILVYKLKNRSREEIEAMFSLSDLKQTRVYQEALQEGKEEGKQEGREEGKRQMALRAVPRYLALGLSVEQIAQELELSVEEVRLIAQASGNQDN